MQLRHLTAIYGSRFPFGETLSWRPAGNEMTSRNKALLSLLIAPPILTEIVSGNTPAHALFDPRIAIFLVLAYSFPLLVIREAALRWRLSTAGVFLLGLAYGILNDGLLAQTLLHYEHVPIDKFDHYLYIGGFNLSWASVIVPWHAFFAVLFPLTLLAFWFPSCAHEAWLSKRFFRVLAATLLALIAFISFVRPPHLQMTVCGLTIGALTCVSSLFGDWNLAPAERNDRRATPFLFGLISYPVFFLGSILLAARRAPASVFFFFITIVFFSLVKMSQRWGYFRQRAAAYLGLGAYLSVSLFHLFAGIARHSPEELLTGALLAAAFLCLAFWRRHAAEF
jgi:hypothetical protein